MTDIERFADSYFRKYLESEIKWAMRFNYCSYDEARVNFDAIQKHVYKKTGIYFSPEVIIEYYKNKGHKIWITEICLPSKISKILHIKY